jgi:outer membrane lipoprotein-sorting protein
LAFLLGRLDLKKDFQNFRVQAGDGGAWLDASAKSARTPYSDIRMLVGAQGEIERLVVAGRDGSVVDYSFSGEKLNIPAPDSLFTFKIPPGAQVVDSVQMTGQGI